MSAPSPEVLVADEKRLKLVEDLVAIALVALERCENALTVRSETPKTTEGK